jgi:hypothetical protein
LREGVRVRKKLLRGGLVAVLALSPSALAACDAEDVKDVKEGVTDVKEGVEDRAKEIEKQVDKNVDTDGPDD